MTTSLFGQSKFGTFKFGATVQTRPRFGFEVDWANRSVFSGANEAPLLQKLSMERGRRYTISAAVIPDRGHWTIERGVVR